MSLARLELVSNHGDQTLSRNAYVVHGTSNATDAYSILDAGMNFVQGRPTFSTNLVHAHDWTLNPAKQAQSFGGGTVVGEPGSVIVCAVPPNLHLGYGIFTSAYIDRQLKRVSGAPIRYAAGRKQLALYASDDTETARIHVEAEVANGYPIEQQPRLQLDPRYILGSFPPNAGLDTVIVALDVRVRSLEVVDFDRSVATLQEMFRLSDPSNASVVPAALRCVILGTVESILISRLRMMRWQGLSLLGYHFLEGKHEAEIAPVRDLAEQRSRMDEMGRLLATSVLLVGDLAWLKVYMARELELMRVEMDGAELRALPD